MQILKGTAKRSLEETMKSRMKLVIIAALLGFVTVAAPRKSSAADKAAVPVAIKIDNFSFTPQNVTISAGKQVTWTNQDVIPHTVVSGDKTTFKSHALDTDEKFSYTFTTPGTY